MSKDLFDELERLRPYADQLKTEADRVNDILDRFAKRLCDMGLGVSAWITLDGEYDELEQYSSRTRLGFDKVKGRWDLYITVEEEAYGHNTGPIELPTRAHSWPRDVRFLAIAKLPELVQALAEEAKQRLQAAERARKALEDVDIQPQEDNR